VTSDESVSAMVQQVIERFGRIDVLINNAGVSTAGAAEESSVAQAHGAFDVNVFGPVRVTKAVRISLAVVRNLTLMTEDTSTGSNRVRRLSPEQLAQWVAMVPCKVRYETRRTGRTRRRTRRRALRMFDRPVELAEIIGNSR
jgi:NAD(P)-dependent dehydrogenase (short-subunit alcohol dehydrogenase family)